MNEIMHKFNLRGEQCWLNGCGSLKESQYFQAIIYCPCLLCHPRRRHTLLPLGKKRRKEKGNYVKFPFSWASANSLRGKGF